MISETDVVHNEPIAIIGIGCRFPGGASNPKKFWEILCNGIDAITDVPPDRWDMRRFYDPDSDKPGKMYVKQAGFLKEKIDWFDPLFFGISPREASYVDPQQRLLLEVTWEAMEDAGIPLEKLDGSNTGVFIGGFDLDQLLLQFNVFNRELINNYSGVGSAMTTLASRISYTFNLLGPCVSMDTACSSSLVATHYACRSLWDGECTLAIAGGTNVMLKPEFFVGMCKAKFLSRHSRCKAFDEQAEGYVRGEGAGVVILKPLSLALKDKDPVYAVIHATGVNQDGQTSGITVPNPDAQEALIKRVCASANISPGDIQYIEAHGTGTQAGDQAEAMALHRALAEGRKPGDKCVIGSVKTNIGHLEAGAGVAGLIKAALCLKHKKIPPNLHFERPNPNIPFDELCIRVPTTLEPWPKVKNKACAGVNSFGFGGTNAHVLLGEPPVFKESSDRRRMEPYCNPLLIRLTARDQNALRQLTEIYYSYLTSDNKGKTVSLDDFAYTTAFRRSHHHYRLAFIAQSREQLCEQLRLFSSWELRPGMCFGKALPQEDRKMVFVCTGMGPQWWAMGRELMDKEPVFRNTMKKCDAIFKQHSGWSLIEELKKDENESRIGKTQVAQPANFAVQVALAALLKSWGIKPDAVVGHSVGEIAAAYIAGALSLEDALLVSYHRSRLQQTLAGKGSMLAVDLSEVEAKGLIESYDKVSIAAINSSSAVTLAGETGVLQEISVLLEENSVFNRFLRVEVAYHSYQMDKLKDELHSCLSDINPQEDEVPLYSTVTGQQVNGRELDKNYWWRNMREPVRFGKAVHTLMRDGYSIFMEIGPHPVLATSIKESLREAGVTGHVLSSLKRKQPELAGMLESLGCLYTLGFPVRWEAIIPYAGHVSLPCYPWQSERYWTESEKSREDRLGLQGHVFLNGNMRLANPAWQVELNEHYFSYMKDHRIENAVVFPAAGYVEAGLALYENMSGKRNVILKELVFHQVLVADDKKIQNIYFSYDPKTKEYSVLSSANDRAEDWKLHATGRISPAIPDDTASRVNIDSLRERCSEEIQSEVFYQMLDGYGLNYGPSFRTLKEIWKGTGEVFAGIEMQDAAMMSGDGYILHPAILDGSIQALMAAADGADDTLQGTFIPVSIERLSFYETPGQKVWSYGTITRRTADLIIGDILILDGDGNVNVSIQGLKCRAIAKEKDIDKNLVNDVLYEFIWQKTEDASGAPLIDKTLTEWLIFTDEDEATRRVTDCLASYNIGYTLVFQNDKYKKTNKGNYHICPENPGDFDKLLNDTADNEFSTILYLWGLNQKNVLPEDLFEESVNHCTALTHIILALHRNRAGKNTDIGIITRGSQIVSTGDTISNLATAPLWGLGFLAGNEYPDIHCRLIDLSPDAPEDKIKAVVHELLSGSEDMDVALREDGKYVKQLVRVPEEPQNKLPETRLTSTGNPVMLEVLTPGRIDGLVYHEMNIKPPGPGEIQIEVSTCGLNYKDLLKVLGQIPPEVINGTYYENMLGMESAGKVVAVGEDVKEFAVSDKVVGFAKGFCSYVNVPAAYAALKPEELSFEEAPVFIGFGTAYHGLVNIAGLQRGEQILIHNATGGVGLAAVQLARWIGAEIFATAGSEEKREYLRSIGVKHVMNSRTLKFADEVREQTDGRGVDVVINAIAGEALFESFSLLAPYGRFIEIGKRDISENNGLPMRAFNNNLTFSAVDMDRLLKERPLVIKGILKAVTRLFNEGHISAMPVSIFPAAEAAGAFRLMAQSNHIGKIVIDIRNQEVPVIATIHKENLFHRDATYLITGGNKGFGLEIAQWVSAKGAGNIVLVSRSGASEETRRAAAVMEQNGTRVEVLPVDIANEIQVKQLVDKIKTHLPPLRGIFHGAAVLDDGFLADMDKSRFSKVMAPKVMGVLNLHQYTEDEPLDFFISFSSISSLIGNPGQGNYVAANSFLDAFAHYRHARGLPATTINLGVLSEVGMAARHGGLDGLFKGSGIRGFTTREALHALEEIIRKDAVQIGFFDIDWSRWAGVNPESANLSRFRQLVTNGVQGQKQNKKLALIEKLSTLGSTARQSLMESMLRETLAVILRIPAEKALPEQSLSSLGVDSLMALELKHAVKDEFGLEISTIEILKGPTISQMSKTFLDMLDLPAGSPYGELLAKADELSDKEVEQHLLQLMEGSDIERYEK